MMEVVGIWVFWLNEAWDSGIPIRGKDEDTHPTISSLGCSRYLITTRLLVRQELAEVNEARLLGCIS